MESSVDVLKKSALAANGIPISDPAKREPRLTNSLRVDLDVFIVKVVNFYSD